MKEREEKIQDLASGAKKEIDTLNEQFIEGYITSEEYINQLGLIGLYKCEQLQNIKAE